MRLHPGLAIVLTTTSRGRSGQLEHRCVNTDIENNLITP